MAKYLDPKEILTAFAVFAFAGIVPVQSSAQDVPGFSIYKVRME